MITHPEKLLSAGKHPIFEGSDPMHRYKVVSENATRLDRKPRCGIVRHVGGGFVIHFLNVNVHRILVKS